MIRRESRDTLGWAAVCIAGAVSAPVPAQQSVVDSRHNLSVSGTGEIRAAGEDQVCIFCHTPHRSSEVRPLWNRASPTTVYQIYQSVSLDANTDQPTGSSKMCLSCHDGSIALGNVLSRDRVIQMAGATSTLPPGRANLGSDLSDDHPISFTYDSALAAQDAHLANPHGLDPRLELDAAGELQCTTCHDPHDDSFGSFLVLDNRASEMCLSCHTGHDTTVNAHRECAACHRTHSARSGPLLLIEESVTDTCMRCHGGADRRAADLRLDLEKISVHATRTPVIDMPAPDDRSRALGPHTSCSDCHEPHTMHSGPPPTAPAVPANFGDQPVRDGASGTSFSIAGYEYEVCFRCHGDDTRARRWPLVSRQYVTSNVRAQFEPSNPSFHPVVAAGRNSDVPSLRAGWTEGSLVLCSDCHGSDSSRKAGGSGPNGVHGSNEPPLLLERYDRFDYTPESAAAYALCYRCHERDGRGGLLGDQSFPHRLHVVDERASCATCHDAHGISGAQGNRVNNSHLINFDLAVVSPDPVTGRLEFEDRGRFSGSCALMCHGAAHSPLDY